jgi:tetraacyldisaccharide 4'-kinase
MNALLGAGASLMEAAWEARRRLYAQGVFKPRRVAARVISIGNLTVGGTGKTTLTLHLARRARELGVPFRIVCRRYCPGPDGRGDEERMYQLALGNSAVIAGQVKWRMAGRAAREADLVLVDDGFSHWRLERDADLVLLDASDPWGGGRMVPAGRLREPRRALQRAEAVVLTRWPEDLPHQDSALVNDVRRAAPAARLAGARHRLKGFRDLAGNACPAPHQAHVVTATGNPGAVVESARRGGCDVISHSFYRDHHWFSAAEVARERRHAASRGSHVLLTAKDAPRWPREGSDDRVIEVAWEWVWGGDAVERLVFPERS